MPNALQGNIKGKFYRHLAFRAEQESVVLPAAASRVKQSNVKRVQPVTIKVLWAELIVKVAI